MALRTPWACDGAGHPLVPPAIVDELREIHPRLGLEYSPGLRAFVVKETWTENDPRRELIKTGEREAWSDWSMLCMVPPDVSLGELRAWLAGQLRLVARSHAELAEWIAANEHALAKAEADAEIARAAAAVEELLMSSSKNIDVGTRRTRVR